MTLTTQLYGLLVCEVDSHLSAQCRLQFKGVLLVHLILQRRVEVNVRSCQLGSSTLNLELRIGSPYALYCIVITTAVLYDSVRSVTLLQLLFKQLWLWLRSSTLIMLFCLFIRCI